MSSTNDKYKFGKAVAEVIDTVDEIFGQILAETGNTIPSVHFAILIGAEAAKFADIYKTMLEQLPEKTQERIKLGVEIMLARTSTIISNDRAEELYQEVHKSVIEMQAELEGLKPSTIT